MVQADKRRASGLSGSAEEAVVESTAMTEHHSETLPEESPKYNLRTPKFSRMRFDWANREDRLTMERGRAEVDRRILHAFADLFVILNDIYTIVRDPELDEHGDVRRDGYGYPIWKKRDGMYIEDFTRLTRRQMEHFIGIITTRLFDWEQTSVDLWADAMFAKAQFEERFAIAFDTPMSGTVDDRRSAGNRDAADERYFAIFATHLSKRAEAIVRSADRLSQRLKDLVTA